MVCMLLSLAIKANNLVHKIMRGRCWNRWVCERLSYAEAKRDEHLTIIRWLNDG